MKFVNVSHLIGQAAIYIVILIPQKATLLHFSDGLGKEVIDSSHHRARIKMSKKIVSFEKRFICKVFLKAHLKLVSRFIDGIFDKAFK